MINLYDWLQAFVSIVNPCTEDEDDNGTDPALQYPLYKMPKSTLVA